METQSARTQRHGPDSGQTVNSVDQLSSVVLLGLALAGAAGVVVLNYLFV